MAIVVLCAAEPLPADDDAKLTGRQIFVRQCAECHGARGQGVAGAADDALYGTRSLEDLTQVIVETMPEGNPEACTGDEARRVAEYIYNTFYTAGARFKSQQARIELVRLTVPQYRNSVADLLASFLGREEAAGEQGLSAEYYNERRRRRDKRVLERIDPQVDFDFGEGPSLEEKVNKDEFFIRWEGSLVVDESGPHEIVVRTGNGMRLWLNAFDDNDEAALIDGWVSSGGKVMEHRVTVELLAWRAYPLRLEFFKYKDKTASIQLLWKPPHKALEVIPPRHLRSESVRPTFIVTTPFPPDDGSVGYERGSAVSQSWDEAATYAAIETAQFVVDRIDRLADTRDSEKDRFQKWQQFCERFAARDFRRELSDEQKQFYIASQFEAAENPEEALKRTILLILKSPQFLYLGLPNGRPDDYLVASRLSYGLWDSLPDDRLREAAQRGELHTAEQVEQHARRMLADPRAKAKLREFFHFWLQLDHAGDLSKDSEAFPEFNEQIVADLRTSLDLFLDSVAWNEEADYRQLLLSEGMFLNRRLAEFYQVGEADQLDNQSFQFVALDPSRRAGVLTHPYLMAALAYRHSSSPIHRGVFLTRRVLSRALSPPPMAIDFNESHFDPQLTTREKVAELTKSQSCMGCHAIINPLGFSLEHFDAVGRYRETEKSKPIDATSDYVTSSGETHKISGARDVAEFAVASEHAQRGFVEQLFHHLVKQPAAAYGDDTLDKLRGDFVQADFNMRSLIVDIMKHTATQGVE